MQTTVQDMMHTMSALLGAAFVCRSRQLYIEDQNVKASVGHSQSRGLVHGDTTRPVGFAEDKAMDFAEVKAVGLAEATPLQLRYSSADKGVLV